MSLLLLNLGGYFKTFSYRGYCFLATPQINDFNLSALLKFDIELGFSAFKNCAVTPWILKKIVSRQLEVEIIVLQG